MCRTYLDLPAECHFDLRLESCAAELLLLLHVGPDFHQSFRGHFIGKQVAIPLGCRSGCCCESQIAGMRLYECVVLFRRVAAMTGPSIVGSNRHHACAHRVQLDVAIARQYVVLAVDKTRLEPALPKRARSPVGAVDIANIVAPQREPGSGNRQETGVRVHFSAEPRDKIHLFSRRPARRRRSACRRSRPSTARSIANPATCPSTIRTDDADVR